MKILKIYKSLINKGFFVKICHFFVSKDILTKGEKQDKIAVTRGGNMRYEKMADVGRYIRILKSSTIDETGYKNVLECKPHFHATKEFLFVSEGEQPVVCGGEAETLSAGEIYFTDSFSLHYYAKSEAEGYVLLISNHYLTYFNEYLKDKTFPSLLKNKEVNKQLFDLVEEWYENAEDDLGNVAYVYKLFSILVKEYGVVDVVKKNQDDVIRKMLEYVEKNYMYDIDLTSMASHIKYSVVYCSKLWNGYIKESFRDYVNRCRVYHINEVLLSKKEKKSILQIAFDNGFNSQSTFYRAYKKVYGKLPSQDK